LLKVIKKTKERDIERFRQDVLRSVFKVTKNLIGEDVYEFEKDQNATPIKVILDKDKMGKLLDVKNTWTELTSWLVRAVEKCENPESEDVIKLTKAEMGKLIKMFDVA